MQKWKENFPHFIPSKFSDKWLFHILTLRRDTSTGFGAAAGRISFLNYNPGALKQGIRTKIIKPDTSKFFCVKQRNIHFNHNQPFQALQRESGLQNEILPLAVDEHLSPLTSVYKTPPATFAGISLFSLPF